MHVSFSRDSAETHDLGSFEVLEVWGNELREGGETGALARHIHHRWHIAGAPHTFTKLQVTGPLLVETLDGERRVLGPYQEFVIFNGVLHTDARVFGFVDVEHDDCYLADLGEHRKGIKLSFYAGR